MVNLLQPLQAVPDQNTHSFSQPTERTQRDVLLPKCFDALVPLAAGCTRVEAYLFVQLDLQGPFQLPISDSPCMQSPRGAELR